MTGKYFNLYCKGCDNFSSEVEVFLHDGLQMVTYLKCRLCGYIKAIVRGMVDN